MALHAAATRARLGDGGAAAYFTALEHRDPAQ